MKKGRSFLAYMRMHITKMFSEVRFLVEDDGRCEYSLNSKLYDKLLLEDQRSWTRTQWSHFIEACGF